MEDWIKYLQLSNGGDFLKGRLKNYCRINERLKLFLWDPKVGPTRPNTICTLSVPIVELDSLLYLEIWAHFKFFAFVSFALIFYELVVYLDEKILKSKKMWSKPLKSPLKTKIIQNIQIIYIIFSLFKNFVVWLNFILFFDLFSRDVPIIHKNKRKINKHKKFE